MNLQHASIVTFAAKRTRALARIALLGACLIATACGKPGAPQPSERQQKALAMWQERCQKAGVFIHRRVENVEGIMLMKVRTSYNFGNQFVLDDPYGGDSVGDSYIKNFLRGFDHQRGQRKLDPGDPPRKGFNYVEAIDAQDGKRYRYTGEVRVISRADINHPNVQAILKRDPNHDLNNYGFVMDKVPAPGEPPRYGVTFDDISTREEREYWIAGSSLKVIDLQTNEVIAERIGYMVDFAQGNNSGGRAPWSFAANNACPSFQWNPNKPIKPSVVPASSYMGGQTLIFVEKVLTPAD